MRARKTPRDDWRLLDELLAVIRRESWPPGEISDALTTCLAKIIVQADMPAEAIEDIKRGLDAAISFQRAIEFER